MAMAPRSIRRKAGHILRSMRSHGANGVRVFRRTDFCVFMFMAKPPLICEINDPPAGRRGIQL